MNSYDSKKVAKVLGVTFRQLQYWDEKGIVKPSVRKASGRGTLRLYSYEDLVQLKVVKKLRDSNISLKKIKRSVDYLKSILPSIENPLAEFSFVTDGDTIFVLTNEKDKLIDTLKSGQITWHIPIDNIVREIAAIEQQETDLNAS